MRKTFLLTTCLMVTSIVVAQPGGRKSTAKTPAGAAYTLTDGSTVNKNKESISTEEPDHNVVQVTDGTLNLTKCTMMKTGDSNSHSGDDTSFYGTNSAVYASGSKAVINMMGGSITTASQGSNAVFATNGATINVNDVTIDNSQSVSRGLHATFGGIINATNINITTRKPTSSTVATDRGGGTVTVTGGTLTAKGEKSAVLYSTGTITVNSLTGLSEQGPIATVEGANHIYINNCSMTSHSQKRGILLHQSHSGDAEGTKPVCSITNSRLTTSDSYAPLCFVTNVAATLTLMDVTLDVASGRLMSVEYEKRGNGSTGHLVLQTTKKHWTYTGSVDADEVNNAAVTVGKNVTWNGAIDPDNNAVSTKVTIEKGAVWNLTADSYVSSLENNGSINKNGYTLTVGTQSGSGILQ